MIIAYFCFEISLLPSSSFAFHFVIRLTLLQLTEIILCETIGQLNDIMKSNMAAPEKFKVPINPKFIFRLNKSFYNSEQNGANNFVFGQNRNFL